MSEKISHIAKNTSYFTLALILQKIISFAYFTLVARDLGPEDLGKYYFAISFTTIMAIFVDIGLANVITREVAKNRAGAGKFLGNILAIKIPLALVTMLLTVAVINIMGYPSLIKDLVYISMIAMVLDSFTLTFCAVSRGFHNLSFESIGSVIYQLIVLITGVLILKFDLGLRWLLGVLSLASVFNTIYSWAILKRYWHLNIRPHFDRELTRKILTFALPFCIYGILQRLYTYLDSVLLSSLAGDVYVGLYQVAFKIIFALQFLPLAFTASLYPAMSAYWANNRPQLVVTFERAMNYLIIISLPIAIGVIAIADKVVLIFKGGYGDAVLPLQITIAAVPFLFINFPIGSLLNACDRQKVNTVNMSIVTVVSIVMNILLIPRFQAVGASITVLVTNILMFVLGMRIVPQIIEYRVGKNAKILFKSLFSGLIMGLAVVYLKRLFNINVFIIVSMAGCLYFGLLFLLGGFNKNDIHGILKSFKKASV